MPLAELYGESAGEHVAYLLALVRIVQRGGAARTELHQYRLHLVFLRVRHQPAYVSAYALAVLLDAHVLVAEHDFFVPGGGEEAAQVAAEGQQYVLQRGYRGGGKVSLDQRNKALRKLAPVRELRLREPPLQAQTLYPFAYQHMPSPLPVSLRFSLIK